ncbi:MAG: hypothetical protein LBD37_02915 [Treponema sp.]|jgi:hypothetical protein|nr:hypothetical protein [Treponema sp.]
MYLFTLCNMASALLTGLFKRLFPAEFSLARPGGVYGKGGARFSLALERCIVLLALSMALCFLISILGGCTSALIAALDAGDPAQMPGGGLGLLRLALVRANLPLALTEALARVPVNVVDRLISVFLGYGAALTLRGLNRNGAVFSNFSR